MKISFICCLFLMVHFCLPVMANETDYVELSRTCDSDHASELSQEISKEMNSLYAELDTLNKSLERTKKKLETIESKKILIDKQYDIYTSQMKVYMIQYQLEYPFYSLDLSGNESEFKRIVSKKQSLDKKYNKLYEECNLITEKIESISSRLSICLEAQENLFNRFYNEFGSYSSDGSYSTFKVIQGREDLPGYGSIYSYDYESNESCLAAGMYSIDSYSSTWKMPIEGGTISAGTWSYPNGGMHLGLDVASNLYSNVVSPANGIILYADTPVDSNNGYLGNWCGWPNGGGNTICMICAVDGKLYGVSFCHLSNEIFVYPGQQVFQNDLIALSGNSGNSTGPHTHIEVFELLVSLEEAVDYFMSGADFSFGNGFDLPETCSVYACRVRPEYYF